MERSERTQQLQYRQRSFRNNPEITQKYSSRCRRQQLQETTLFITNIFKGYKIIDLTRPIELMTNKVATRNLVEYGSRNNYVLLVATWQNTLYSTTLFSSKKEHSASKIGVSGIAGQHGLGEAYRHLSTQVRCDTRSGADLHRTVARQTGRINPDLLDEGTYPTS
jgi:hypothetical protein